MAKKRSPEKGPQDETVYRVKHISRAAWEEGSMTLPGLPEDAVNRLAQLNGNESSLDKLDDSLVEMAMTQEISLELIREYLRREEEQAKQRLLEKSRQRQAPAAPASPVSGYGPIQPDEIVGYHRSEARPAKKEPEKPRAQKPQPQKKPRPLPRPKPEIADEPFAEQKPKKTAPKKFVKPKEDKKSALKPLKKLEIKSQEKKSDKKREQNRGNPLVWTANTLRALDFWHDDCALYYVPLGTIFDYCYRNIYYFGLRFARPILLTARYALPYLLHPILAMWHLLRAVALAVHHVTIGRIRRRTMAGKKKHEKRLMARENAGSKVTPFIAMKEFAADYRTILSSAVNTLLPAAALVVLLLVVQLMMSQTYALQVIMDNSTVGFIANESVYLSAQAAANQHIAPKPVHDVPDAEDSLKTHAQYQLVRVGPEQLTSADRLTDELLGNATDPMTSACGVYIADEAGGESRLVATTKNSTDANWVLERLKQEKSRGLTIVEGATVGFVQQIDLVPGFYPESQLTDPDKLLGMLSGNDVGGVPYTIEDGDTLWNVAFKFKISYDKLLNMNPQLIGNETRLHPGDEILISEEVPVLQLKVVQTERRIIEVPYEIIARDNDAMFRGTSRTIVKGENGEEEIYERVTYINNTRQSGAVPIGVPRRLKEPVTEVKENGTKSTLVDPTVPPINPGKTGFTWPVPTVHAISSYYGNRKGRMHNGIDITNGNAYGHTVVAAMDGVITHVGWTNDGFGYNVIIDHGGGVQTLYGHMINGSCPYSRGSRVGIGRPIGRVGSTGNSTGPHLHFEVRINGRRDNPLNYVRP